MIGPQFTRPGHRLIVFREKIYGKLFSKLQAPWLLLSRQFFFGGVDVYGTTLLGTWVNMHVVLKEWTDYDCLPAAAENCPRGSRKSVHMSSQQDKILRVKGSKHVTYYKNARITTPKLSLYFSFLKYAKNHPDWICSCFFLIKTFCFRDSPHFKKLNMYRLWHLITVLGISAGVRQRNPKVILLETWYRGECQKNVFLNFVSVSTSHYFCCGMTNVYLFKGDMYCIPNLRYRDSLCPFILEISMNQSVGRRWNLFAKACVALLTQDAGDAFCSFFWGWLNITQKGGLT